ncbi:LysR substrate-binding domain-containing protein [Corallococcus sp. bb12-1]|uniref:LysR substrate-binding domain-containing protein n=1 Tax=Corallococcus sp. bb12-1 TaxID=2996784 RepID=UPI00226E056A|nr:LysR substrate-binding domain-containing protein [Corallococcus sp. bb12-1]MCY1042283.1 LysR substrate-binding domain-containing protein [Corallococcus sp. bb12-1]
MARLDINRSGEMEVFVRVVEQEGFSAAARTLRMTPSAVSKLVARLEARLGARLLHRNTRGFQLTSEGCVFYERSVQVLAELEEAERGVATNEAPSGRVRINTNVPYGTHFLLPRVPAFLARNPGITLDIALTDQVVDLLEERADVAIRAGPLKSSNLIARRLGESRKMIVASPDYLKRMCAPKTVAELERHNRMGASHMPTLEHWPVVERGAVVNVPCAGTVQASDGEALRQLALVGAGLARIAAFQVREDVAAGRLVAVLEERNPGDTVVFHAVFLDPARHLPARIRAFLDYFGEVGMG